MQGTVIEWDGAHLPSELRGLPPGRYLVAPIEDEEGLSEEEDTAVNLGLDELEAGRVLNFDEVVLQLRERVRRE